MTFIELFLDGQVSFQEVDDFVDAWHDGTSDLSLQEYLGMNRDEYVIFLTNPKQLEQDLLQRKVK